MYSTESVWPYTNSIVLIKSTMVEIWPSWPWTKFWSTRPSWPPTQIWRHWTELASGEIWSFLAKSTVTKIWSYWA